MNNDFLNSTPENEDSYIGQWEMKVNAKSFLVLTLSRKAHGLKGFIRCPARFSTLGNLFFSVSAAITTFEVLAVHMHEEQLLFDAKDGNEGATCHCAMFLKTADQALLTGFRSSYEPWILNRSHSEKLETGAASFEPNRSYSQDDCDTPNSEIQRIFDEDQVSSTSFDDSSASPLAAESNRCEVIRNLIAAGKLCSGLDFEQAAFILHHAATAQDYLLAHTLATVALAKGNSRAIWIVAATLDRYLQATGKSQIYGTQFESQDDGMVTQEPYDHAFIPDIIRRHLGVPPLYLQEERIKNATLLAFPTKSKQ